MRNWDDLTTQALRNLDADTEMVPGAKLRQKMVELGRQDGFDVAGYIANSPDSFSTLVRRVENVEVRIRPGSDLLIGLSGAHAPSGAQAAGPEFANRGLRKDVYEAFTQISSVPFVYLPGTDRFVPEDRADGASIAIPDVTLNGLIEDRHNFVGTLPPDEQKPLIDALNGSPNPLSEFRREAVNRQIIGKWAAWQSQRIAYRVADWAKENELTVRTAWFRRDRTPESPHRTLTRLVPYLTADEIRDLRIPFRAIEALLRGQNER